MDSVKSNVPPILPDIGEELHDYLICLERLPIHEFQRNQQFWPREPEPSSLFHYDNSPLCTTLTAQRDPSTGEILKFEETLIENPRSEQIKSLHGPHVDSIINTNLISSSFWGDGIAEVKILGNTNKSSDEDELFVIPPGFSRGLIFEADGCTVKKDCDEVDTFSKPLQPDIRKTIDLKSLVEQEQNSLTIFETASEISTQHDISKPQPDRLLLPDEDEIIPKETPVLFISKETVRPGHRSTEWAQVLDCTIPVTDFERQVPRMAHHFPFELDNFQKLAIIQLERHNHVLVAAHTSAGKTVIAEYAIALSQQHMTRAIYTSPIKALSNQKYRDFKDTFKDVGLITGDFQVNQKASCLIMTTEILLSMLHCEGKVSSDLEFVIFDEVHYINDKERGHVWEQVLIKLPSHVCIILLSATFPRPAEFADWLGRTKQRKVYVVSTYQRPVPLQHFLYTARDKGHGDSKYLIMGNKFVDEGYYSAVESLQRKKVPAAASAQKGKPPGAKTPPVKKEPYRSNTSLMNRKEEKTLMYTLIHYLEKQKLLPAVMFIFSRANCDHLAIELTNVDLTTQEEKRYIKGFFNISIKGLKPPDREIPQIMRMSEILQRGVGVHHSGILPILKEVVEMLFQTGKLKLLFTTETFAMGVNMPTRTVIFDSVTKHDGQTRRNLTPAEYIQMAGRAGRRGKDKFGTVLILCKGQVPSLQSLREIMLYRPSQLTSQFRLTYGMILNTLRGEEKKQTVEEVISKSFMENDHQKKTEEIQVTIKKIEKELEELRSEELSGHLEPLVAFYDWARGYLNLRNEYWNNIVASVKDILLPGRIVLIIHKNHINKPAMLLTPLNLATRTLQVLILADKDENIDTVDRDDEWYWMLGLAKEKIAEPDTGGKHLLLEISLQDVFEISSKRISVDNPQLIIDDVKKRQVERFRNDRAGKTCEYAVQELIKMGMETSASKEKALDCLKLIDDLPVREVELHEAAKEIVKKKEKFVDHLLFTSMPNFEHNFYNVFKRKHLEDKRRNLSLQLSYKSMELYTEYEKRIRILQELRYVTPENTVTQKGKVACCMSMNEILITELVFDGALMKLESVEIAALFSIIIAKAKKKDESKEDLLSDLPSSLLDAIQQLEAIDDRIKLLEREYDLQNDEFAELNYGLVKVVYEWTSQKPFAEIMELTDIQEGIIVRCIQQLNETICDIKSGACVVGSSQLQKKMEETSLALKRDIVFATSLYMNEEVCKHLKPST